MKLRLKNGKIVKILTVILVVLGAGFYFYNQKIVKKPPLPEGPSENTQKGTSGESEVTNSILAPDNTNKNPIQSQDTKKTIKENTAEKIISGRYSSGEETIAPDIQVAEIIFDGKGYSPSSLIMRVGDWLFIKNSSSTQCWPIADNPETKSTLTDFNPEKVLGSGGEYRYQFKQAENFGFKDSLHPNALFSVQVTK